ncbi:MAG TPA: hypothetical protein VI391_00970 [Thermoanaerobaculia bacterium]
MLASVVMDPFVGAELAYYQTDLYVHYASPVIDGNDVFLEIKRGSFTPGNWSTQRWGVQALRWQSGQLVPRWTTMTDWTPVPYTGDGGPSFEPAFQPVLANGFLYMPGVGGTVLRVNRDTGAIIDHLGPQVFPADRIPVVSGPLVADSAGNIYYNIIELTAANNPWTVDVKGALLEKIAPDGTVTAATYSTIVSGAPAAADQCLGSFADSQLPWPPKPDAVPPSAPCGSQRPGVNVAPAIASDGTIYTISRAHFNSRYGYLVALNSDLTPKWARSLRDRFHDGCNVLLPPNGTPGGCRAGAVTGVDPSDNTLGAGRVVDDSSSSPLIAPDGSVFYGAYTRYNWTQGHLMHFSPSGSYLGAYPFGWDVTPGIYTHDNTYSVISKENHYEVGSYCDTCAGGREPGYFIVALDPSLERQWVAATITGFEWCINSPAIDANGSVYINSEDGSLYAFNADGSLRESVRLTDAIGQAYTPVVIDGAGRIYAEKAGTVFVVGSEPRVRAVR